MRIIYVFCFLIIIISLSILIKKLCFFKQIANNTDISSNTVKTNNNINYTKNTTENTTENKLIIYTTSWCGNCRQLKPTIKDLKKKIKENLSVVVEEIDCDKDRDKCYVIKDGSNTMISSVPTIVLRKKGKDDKVYLGRDTKLSSLYDFVTSNI